MIEETQFNVALKVLGKDLVLDRLFSTFSELETLLGGMARAEQSALSQLDSLHAHLNVVTSLGAKKLATKLADMETQLREGRQVAAEEFDTLFGALDATKSAYFELTGQSAGGASAQDLQSEPCRS